MILTDKPTKMKQETLEKVAERLYPTPQPYELYSDIGNSMKREAFIAGTRWMQERMYSEEDMRLSFETGRNFQLTGENNFNELIDQFKKE